MPTYTGGSSSNIKTMNLGETGTVTTNMRLFGLPYQFTSTVDPRIRTTSEKVGYNYIEKILMTAPTVFIIPGKSVFLPNVKKSERESTAHALLEASHESFQPLLNKVSDKASHKLRYYDFQESYTEYMKYVNAMCRTVAVFLELTESLDGTSLQQYSWQNYRFNKEKYASGAISTASYVIGSTLSIIRSAWSKFSNAIRGTSVSDLDISKTLNVSSSSSAAKTCNFVQFYVDPSATAQQSIGNETSSSTIKSGLDSLSSTVREYTSVAQAAGVDLTGLEDLTSSGLDALSQTAGNSSVGKILSQVLSAGSAVVKGDNIMLPEIYQSSSYGVSYSINIHLKSPYGDKYAVYTDVIVPLLHLLALCIPRQGTANTYGSPFLIKCYFPGVFNCNLGIVESMDITRPSSDDAWSVDGLPTEIDVELRIKDLYSDLIMSPSNDPNLFQNNTSLIDYLATISGLSLIEPQMSTRAEMWINNWGSAIRDIDDNVKAGILDTIERKFSGFLSL